MARNKITDLRDHLFAVIEGLQDEEKPFDVEKAKVIADLAQVVVNSAKIEVDLLKYYGGTGTGFINLEPKGVHGMDGKENKELKS